MIQLDIWGNPSTLVINKVIVTQIYLNSKLLRYYDSSGTSWESSWGPFPDLEYKCEFINFNHRYVIEGYIKWHLDGRKIIFNVDVSRGEELHLITLLSEELTREIDAEILREVISLGSNFITRF